MCGNIFNLKDGRQRLKSDNSRDVRSSFGLGKGSYSLKFDAVFRTSEFKSVYIREKGACDDGQYIVNTYATRKVKYSES